MPTNACEKSYFEIWHGYKPTIKNLKLLVAKLLYFSCVEKKKLHNTDKEGSILVCVIMQIYLKDTLSLIKKKQAK